MMEIFWKRKDREEKDEGNRVKDSVAKETKNIVNDSVQQEDNETYLMEVKKAWGEWQAAQKYFESVSDPDLIDYAIYDIEAARRKYVYMLKQARSKGLQEKKFVI